MARKPQSIVLRAVLCFIVLPVLPDRAPAQAGAGAEILLAARHTHLAMCNKYQQRMTGEELSALEPFVPMVVLVLRETLGDGITPCSRISIRGETFYLLHNSDGSFAGDPNRAGLIALRGVVIVGDTIIVRQGTALAMANPVRTATTFLRPGERIRREFQHAGATYVRRLGATTAYGWLSLPAQATDDWEMFRPAARNAAADMVEIFSIAQHVAGRANRTLTMLYRALQEEQASPSIPPPSIQVERAGNSVLCRIVPPGRAGQFRETIAALIEDLHRRTSPFGAVCAESGAGLITIHR